MSLKLQPQEIPLDHADSKYRFQPGPEKPFLATPAAIEAYTRETIIACLWYLQTLAERHDGLDYLQVFHDETPPQKKLWFIEDGPGGAINALLPSDY